MPCVHIFDNCARSSGSGFIKPPSSGMWKCTLHSQSERRLCQNQLVRKDEELETTAQDKGFMSEQKATSNITPPRVARRKMLQSPHPGGLVTFPLSNLQQFQLVSTNSRFLCSVFVLSGTWPTEKMIVASVQRILPGAQAPASSGIAFASAAEATWMDVVLFLYEQQVMRRVPDELPNVWRLQWSAAGVCGAEDVTDLDIGSTLVCRLTATLPLNDLVQNTLSQEEDVLCVVIARGNARKTDTRKKAETIIAEKTGGTGLTDAVSTKVADGIPRCTPLGRTTAEAFGPPAMQRKSAKGRDKSAVTTPPKDLTVEFATAEKESETTLGSPTVRGDKISRADVGIPTSVECENKQPTYAEILMRGLRTCDVGLPPERRDLGMQRWRRHVKALRNEVSRVEAGAETLYFAKERWARYHQQRAVRHGGLIDLFVSATLKEFMCEAQLTVAAHRRLLSNKKRGVLSLLRRCVSMAEELYDEVGKWPGDNATEVRFPKLVMGLRLLRHKCFATVLMNKAVTALMSAEAMKLCVSLLRLVKEGVMVANCVHMRVEGSTASLREMYIGLYTAALAAAEISLLGHESRPLKDDMTFVAGELVQLCCTVYVGNSVPASLLALVELGAAKQHGSCNRGAERLRELLLPTEAPGITATSDAEAINAVDLCCGIVRCVPSSAAFDQGFTRLGALLRRFNCSGRTELAEGGDGTL